MKNFLLLLIILCFPLRCAQEPENYIDKKEVVDYRDFKNMSKEQKIKQLGFDPDTADWDVLDAEVDKFINATDEEMREMLKEGVQKHQADIEKKVKEINEKERLF